MKVAVIQLDAGPEKEKNVRQALEMTKEAIAKKARWILLPEVFHYRGALNRKNISLLAETIPGESTRPLMALAKKHHVFILAGSILERSGVLHKAANTSVLINDKGVIQARYRKQHLFEAEVNGKKISESAVFVPGRLAVTTRVGEFNVGLSVCFDLRFPLLYRAYSRRGCHVITVPSAFTRETGQAHWEVLLRARAVENFCYVLAPNQTGVGAKGIASYGNSMIISPWGEILARASARKSEIIFAEIRKTDIIKVRKRMKISTAGRG